jgi:hypothetical protein
MFSRQNDSKSSGKNGDRKPLAENCHFKGNFSYPNVELLVFFIAGMGDKKISGTLGTRP